MNQARKPLGKLLMDMSRIDQYQLSAALAEQKKWGGRLGGHLVKLKFITERQLVEGLSLQLGIPVIELDKVSLLEELAKLIPSNIAEKSKVIPVRLIEPGENEGVHKRTLIVATSDPTNLEAMDEVRFITGTDIHWVLVGDQELQKAIKRYYHGELAGSIELESPRDEGKPEKNWEVVSQGQIRQLPISQKAVKNVSRDSGPGVEELEKRLNAVVRLLIKKGVFSQVDLLDEQKK